MSFRGAGDLLQMFARPLCARDPYATAMDGVYLCSSSTPPGTGVRGVCGFHAAWIGQNTPFSTEFVALREKVD